MYPYLQLNHYLQRYQYQYLTLYAGTIIHICIYARSCVFTEPVSVLQSPHLRLSVSSQRFLCNPLHISSTTTIHQLDGPAKKCGFLFISCVYLRTLSAQSEFKSCAQGLFVCFNAFHASHTMTWLQILFNCGCGKSGKQMVVSI